MALLCCIFMISTMCKSIGSLNAEAPVDPSAGAGARIARTESTMEEARETARSEGSLVEREVVAMEMRRERSSSGVCLN